ncbi:type III-A CRISPR-associated protein Csm2 [Actinobacillus genomosp. 1]|uniref:type III-A CRISPR-associated protein Csm2 n=1 Tax=Actinobacillus genomosp. 1 TaxID=254839 RepID=UPI002441C452|nr:type III-A CRISPR-associated protein Csm2 [Actinobacillus genomosp. 1]WGE91135.1 type III-A CRISPR-associated protein Csm2 [Actinobacillus genomosp. 1]
MNIKFGTGRPDEIFSDIAQAAAQKIKSNANANKTTQLRKFYDELAMWNERVQFLKKANEREAKFKELLPFIKMLKAKVAYANGRKHVDNNFLNIFNDCIDEINSVDTLRDAKLFMEAVMGFCKLEEKN